MPEDAHNLSASDDHTNLSVPTLAPEQRPGGVASTVLPRVSRIPPRRVALCGGGVRGVAHVGVMKALRDQGFLGHVKEVLGVSAGSLFALLWVLEYTVEQIEQLALEFDFTLLRNIDPDSIFEFPTKFGLDDGAGIEKLVTSILKHKGFGPDTTFQQIAAKYPTRFRCFATEVETSRVRHFGTLESPTISVKLAIRASMALPIFYTPVKDPHTGRLLLDGGLLNNLPIVFLNESEMRDTLCVFFTRWEYGKVVPITNMLDMLNGIYDSALILKSRPYVEKYKDSIVVVPTTDFGAMNFEESRESRELLVAEAYKRTQKFLFTQHWTPQRRFSVS